MAKIYVDNVPIFEIAGGMVHVTRADGVCEAWPISVFSDAVREGLRVVREFHSRATEPVRIKAKPGGGH